MYFSEIHEHLKRRSEVTRLVRTAHTKLQDRSWKTAIPVWNTRTWKRVGERLKVCGICVRSVAFSPNGNKNTSNSWDDGIRLWDFESAACVGISLENRLRNMLCTIYQRWNWWGILIRCLELRSIEVGHGYVPHRMTKQCECGMRLQRNNRATIKRSHSGSQLRLSNTSNSTICISATSTASSEMGFWTIPSLNFKSTWREMRRFSTGTSPLFKLSSKSTILAKKRDEKLKWHCTNYCSWQPTFSAIWSSQRKFSTD